MCQWKCIYIEPEKRTKCAILSRQNIMQCPRDSVVDIAMPDPQDSLVDIAMPEVVYLTELLIVVSHMLLQSVCKGCRGKV